MATYIIRAGLAGPVKIGKADDVEARREALQTGHHETLHVLRVLDTPFDAEPIMHLKFAGLRIRGEWFEFCEEMLAFVPEAPVAPETVPPSGATWPEVLSPWSDRDIAKRIGCSMAIVKRWRQGVSGPSGRFAFAMLCHKDLWSLPLLAAGRSDIVYADKTIAGLKERLLGPRKEVERIERDEAATRRGHGWRSDGATADGIDRKGQP